MKRVVITLVIAIFVVSAGLPAIAAFARARSDAASEPAATSSYETPSLGTAGKAENQKP